MVFWMKLWTRSINLWGKCDDLCRYERIKDNGSIKSRLSGHIKAVIKSNKIYAQVLYKEFLDDFSITLPRITDIYEVKTVNTQNSIFS